MAPKKFILLFLSTLFFLSCSVEKRRYSDGYYINSKVGNQTKKIAAKSTNQSESDSIFHEEKSDYNLNNFASIANSEIFYPEKGNILETNIPEETCDNIILRNGSEIKGKVTEITLTEVKYRKCDNLDGPTISIAKPDVFMIQYLNGTREILKDEKVESNKGNSNTEYVNPPVPRKTTYYGNKREALGLISFIMSCVGFFVFGIPIGITSIILGIISIAIVSSNQEKYKPSKAFAIWGIVIGAIDIVGAIIGIALLL